MYCHLMAMDYGLTIYLAGKVCELGGGCILDCHAGHWEVPMWLSRKKGDITLKDEATSSVHGNQCVVKLKFAGMKLLYCLQAVGIVRYI